MPDRIIRDELLLSDRWLDLPSDTHRLVYQNLLLIADDYGNLKGGPRRLYRWMHSFSQVKSEADAIKLMSDLQDADLARRYEAPDADGVALEYWHLPRFRNSRRYWARKCPASPFVEQEMPPNQRRGKKMSANRHNVSRGVGVGVGEKPLHTAVATPGARQNLLKNPPQPEATPEHIAKQKRIAALLAEGKVEEARRVKEGLE